MTPCESAVERTPVDDGIMKACKPVSHRHGGDSRRGRNRPPRERSCCGSIRRSMKYCETRRRRPARRSMTGAAACSPRPAVVASNQPRTSSVPSARIRRRICWGSWLTDRSHAANWQPVRMSISWWCSQSGCRSRGPSTGSGRVWCRIGTAARSICISCICRRPAIP